MILVLASQSMARRRVLEAAGVPHIAVASPIDEDAVKQRLRQDGAGACLLAESLAAAKALAAAPQHRGALVLGCDQTLGLDDGTMLDKAPDMAALAGQLAQLSGRSHSLYSALAIVEGDMIIWRHVEEVRMQMRPLSPGFIDDYLAQEGESLLQGVGGYRIESRGSQLFNAIEGNNFAVMGLPLLPLLGFLRTRGIVAS